MCAAALIGTEAKKYEPVNAIEINPLDFEMKTFENKINHFDVRDYRTYNQRYWVNTQYWPADQSGPNLIYLCGEYACSVN